MCVKCSSIVTAELELITLLLLLLDASCISAPHFLAVVARQIEWDESNGACSFLIL